MSTTVASRLAALGIDLWMFDVLAEKGLNIEFLEALEELLREKLTSSSNAFWDPTDPDKLTVFPRVNLGNVLCQEKVTILQG